MSIRKVYTTLNVRKAESQTTIEGLHVGDVGSTQLIISLTDGTRAIDLTKFSTVTAMIHGKKPDGYEIHNQCDVEGGKILYTLTAQDTAVSGTVYYQLDVHGSGEERCFSPCFRTQVSERVYEPVFRLLTGVEAPEDWAQNYAKYYKKVDDVYVKNNDPTYAADTFYVLVDPPVDSASEFLAFWSAFHKVEGLFNQRLIVDYTTLNVGYDADNKHKVFINANIQTGVKGIVFTGQNNRQYAICSDGLFRVRGKAVGDEYLEWEVKALATEITSSNKNDNNLIPSIKAVVDYIASEISGKANADEVNAALAEKANVNHTHDMSNYVTLQAMIAALANKADTSAVPTKTSDLTNDSGFLTEHQDLSPYALAATVAASLALKADKDNSVSYKTLTAGSIYQVADNQIDDEKTIYRVFDILFGWGLMFNVITETLHAQIILTQQGKILYRKKGKNQEWGNIRFTDVLSDYATTSDLSTGLAGKANVGDIPTVPTNVSAFTNDAGYLTEGDFSNKVSYVTESNINNCTSPNKIYFIDIGNSEAHEYALVFCSTDIVGDYAQFALTNKGRLLLRKKVNDTWENDFTELIPDLSAYVTTSAMNTALADKADKATTYTKIQTEAKITDDIISKLSVESDGDLVYTDDGVPYVLSQLADLFYTKTQVDSSLSGKADTATTLAGYGITDGYKRIAVLSSVINNCDNPDTIYFVTVNNPQTSIIPVNDGESVLVLCNKLSANNLIQYGLTLDGRILTRKKVNGTWESKFNDIIPTKTSQLNNDSGFLTQHQDISGKADKATTYTKDEVNTAIQTAIGGIENGSY